MLYKEGYNGAYSHPLYLIQLMVINFIKHRRSVRLMVTNFIKHRRSVQLMVINSVKRFLVVIYIYRFKYFYKAFMLHLNSFFKYYSLFIYFYKIYSFNLYFTPIFLFRVPNQYNFLNIILLYFTLKVLCLHFTQKKTYS